MTALAETGICLNRALRLHVPPILEEGRRHRPVPPFRGMILGEPLLRGEPINTTEGWDSVFAVPVPKVNAHFAKPGNCPTDFRQTVPSRWFDTAIEGKFKPWYIVTGGSGSIIKMRCDVRSGTLAMGRGSDTEDYDIAGSYLLIEIKLNYLPQPSQGANGQPNALKVRTSAMDESGKAVHVIGFVIPGEKDPMVVSAGQAAFQEWFNAHLDLVTYVFNTVNLNVVAGQAQFQWLQPTYTTYAYYDAADIDRAVFGVLCMVGKNGPGTNPQQIGPAAIPQGCQSGYSISNQLFMEKMVLPVMANAFNAGNDRATIDDSYFKLANADTEIVNTKTIPLESVKYGAIWYHPDCIEFKCTIQAQQLVLYTKIWVHISPGIDAYVEQTCYYGVELTTGTDGTQYLNFVEIAPPSTNSWTDIADWVIITELVVAIVGAVCGAIVGAIQKTAKAIVTGIIIAIVFGVAAAVPEMIAAITAKGVVGNTPPVNQLVTAATSPVRWTGGEAFVITKAQLNGTFQMGGNAFPND